MCGTRSHYIKGTDDNLYVFSRGWGVPGEPTHDSDNMGNGFDDMDDSSPFLAEPTYDPQHGGWLTKEMRAHLKILQTGTANQVDLHQVKEEDIPPLNADKRAIAVVPQPKLPGEQSCGWMTEELSEEDALKMELDDQLPVPKSNRNVAIQCMLLGDPLEHDPIEWPRVVGKGTQQQGSGAGDVDAPTNDAPCQGDQECTTSFTEPNGTAPLTESDWGLGELAQSCNLVRLSHPIVWSQRKWLPSPEK